MTIGDLNDPLLNASKVYYSVEHSQVTITGYDGIDTELVLPVVIDEKPVTAIGDNAFKNCTNKKVLRLPTV